MAEAGGPTTQSGIYYQNTIATRYLGALLDLRVPSLAGTSRVLSVRVEAPEHIDDTIVKFSDGHTLFIQVKEALSTNGEAWDKFWASAGRQADSNPNLRDEFRLIIGTVAEPIQMLREVVDRAKGKHSAKEWTQALSKVQQKMARAMLNSIGKHDEAGFAVVKRMQVELMTLVDAESLGVRDWMPQSSAAGATLFSHLRDLCGGRARIRQTFHAGELSEHLLTKFSVRVHGSHGDELERYRVALAAKLDHISVPGTAVSSTQADLFVWPEIRAVDRATYHDFEDEDGRPDPGISLETVDFTKFPSSALQLVVLESGAGHGKSTILRATARRIASSTSFIPSIFNADDAAQCSSLLEYLETEYNPSYGLSIDWAGLCNQGRAVLVIDGIDEVEDSARSRLGEMISNTAALFPRVAFLVGARDSSIAQLPPNFKLLRVQALDADRITDMIARYTRVRSSSQRQDIAAHVRNHPELEQLCRVPLFLSIFAATLPSRGPAPVSRAELLEHYLVHALSPERYKGTPKSVLGKTTLRRGATTVAVLALRSGRSAVQESKARAILTEVLGPEGDVCLDTLVQHGLLRRNQTRISFSLPTVQEYLSGCALADSGEIRSIDLLQQLYQRSWAQSFLFAVERLDDADELLSAQLAKPDDVFYTGLRFVARCIANGAHVRSQLKDQVAEGLFAAWRGTSHQTSQRISQLVVDAFCLPVRAELRRQLLSPEVDHFDSAPILRRINNHALTLECLKVVLEKADIRYLCSRDWTELIFAVADDAVNLLTARARTRSEVYSDNVVAEALFRMRSASIDWHAISGDDSLPAVVRAAAEFGLPNGPESADLIELALAESTHAYLWHGFQDAYTSTVWWKHHLRIACKSPTYFKKEKSPLDAIYSDDEISVELLEELAAIASDEATHPTQRFRLSAMLGGHCIGDFARIATQSLATIDCKLLNEWVSETTYLPEDQVLVGIEILRSRNLDLTMRLRLIEGLARYSMQVPSGARRSLMARGPFRSRISPGAAAIAALHWAEHVIETCVSLSSFERRSLVLTCAQLRSPRWAQAIIQLVEEFLDENDHISEESWSWFATSVNLIIDGGDLGRSIRCRIWEILTKGNEHPVGWILINLVNRTGEPSDDELLGYLSTGRSRNARYWIFDYFERATERKGLRLERVNREFRLMKMR